MNTLESAAVSLPPVVRPTARFMLAHPAHLIALGFGSGLGRIAPGTVGTLWGWLAFLLLHQVLSDLGLAVWIAVSALVGWWACTVTSSHLGVADSGHIVWDEIVAFWLVLWLVLPAGLGMQLAAFALFRFFDAAKPGPVAWADRHFKGFGARGGFGILFDDVVAAFCTLLVLALGVFLWS
jgi:phosphatidylglycerophosphatase A